MVTLTKTLFDVADCNITWHYLGDAAADDPLAFASAESYNALYQQIVETRTSYEDVRGHAGEVLKQLVGAFSPNKFWQRYLGSRDEETYAAAAWENLVPIAAKLQQRVEIALPECIDLTVSPEPRVLLHPFGWSTWIGFRIVGDHTLSMLATLVTHLMEGAAYRLSEKPEEALTLTQLFDLVARGVLNDGYGGKKVAVFNPQDTLAVTTVVGKHGGSPSLGALEEDEAAALKKIVRSAGAAPAKKLAVRLPQGESELLDFVLHDGLSWFLWAEHRLGPFERNAQRLRCYHNNTFRSLLQAWLLQTLLDRALKTKAWSNTLTDLAERATQLLAAPAYRNFSMLAYLELEEHLKVRASAEKRLAPAGGKAG